MAREKALQRKIVQLREQVVALELDRINAIALLQSMPLHFGTANSLIEHVHVVVRMWKRASLA
jgi:hypothetical protein